MKKFWLLVIGSLLIKIAVLTIVFMVFDLWGFWAVPWAYGIVILTTMGRYGVEYWAMNREAGKFKENLEFFARVLYDSGWSLTQIQMHPDGFKRELEKRKLSWMKNEK